MENGIQPVMPVGGYGNCDGFGNGGLWLFAILALMWGGFGNNRFNNGMEGRCATVEDLNNSANFTRLESQVQANGQSINSALTNLGNGICSLGYELASKFGSLEKTIGDCCCAVERGLLENRYLAGQNTSAILQAQERGTQRIIDYLCSLETQKLRDENLRGYIDQKFCGVPRYLPGTTYGAVPSPLYNPAPFGGFACGGCAN